MSKCYFHKQYDSVGTISIIDRENSGLELWQQQYKRVPVCFGCASFYKKVNTARYEDYPKEQKELNL